MWLKNDEKLVFCQLVFLFPDVDCNDTGGDDLRLRFLLFAENPVIDLSLLKLVNFRLIHAEIDRPFLCLDGFLVVICVENRPFQQKTQSRCFGDGDLSRPIRVSDPLRHTAASHHQSSHSDHFANLVHHETLSVDFQTQPLRVVDDNGCLIELEGLDVPSG